LGKKVEMLGKRFGRLVVLSETDKRDKCGNVYYLCECDCGTRKTISGASLRQGRTVSCGCYNKEVITGDKVPGGSRKGLYRVWYSMLMRCNNENNKDFHNYGARGISVCKEWQNSYEAFYHWATQSGYRQGLTLDRIDNDGNYSPENCRWATWKQQHNNKRSNKKIKYGGKLFTEATLADHIGIGKATLRRRIELGWSPKDYGKPVDKRYSHSEAIKRSYRKQNPRTEVTITRIESEETP
jgi:hypothetical protein